MNEYFNIKRKIMLELKQDEVMDEYIDQYLKPYMSKYRFDYDDRKLLIHEFFVMIRKMRSVKLDDSK